MAQVLVVDDDLGTLETFSTILGEAGFGVASAQSGNEALRLLRSSPTRVALADLRLPDISGIALLARIQSECIPVRVIIMTAFGTVSSAVEALRLGAFDFVEKPLMEEDVLRLVRAGLSASLRTHDEIAGGLGVSPRAHAAIRWAQAIISVISVEFDPRTLPEWAEIANTSRATLENRCRAAGVSAKASLDFARMLRAIVQARQIGCRPEILLEIDPRTFHRWASFAPGEAPSSSCSPLEFIESQRFVTDPLTLDVLKREFARNGIPLSNHGHGDEETV